MLARLDARATEPQMSKWPKITSRASWVYGVLTQYRVCLHEAQTGNLGRPVLSSLLHSA